MDGKEWVTVVSRKRSRASPINAAASHQPQPPSRSVLSSTSVHTPTASPQSHPHVPALAHTANATNVAPISKPIAASHSTQSGRMDRPPARATSDPPHPKRQPPSSSPAHKLPRTATSSDVAAAAVATAPHSRPPALFQDPAILRSMNIDPAAYERVVMLCHLPLQVVCGSAYVHTAVDGTVRSVATPPRRVQTARARVLLRRIFGLACPTEAVAPIPKSAQDEQAVLAHLAPLGSVGALTFAVYGCESIAILPPRQTLHPDASFFRLCLSYRDAVVGRVCLRALQSAVQDRSPVDGESKQSGRPALRLGDIAKISPGRNRFICGRITRWPGLLPPDAAELARLLDSVQARDVYLSPRLKEMTFIGELSFAVDERHASQLGRLVSAMPSLRFHKLMEPDRQVCSGCWRSGHSRGACQSPSPLCKHCASPDHTGAECPILSGAKSQWPACLLCKKNGHCVTACPLFKPRVMQLDVKAQRAPLDERVRQDAAAFPPFPGPAGPTIRGALDSQLGVGPKPAMRPLIAVPPTAVDPSYCTVASGAPALPSAPPSGHRPVVVKRSARGAAAVASSGVSPTQIPSLAVAGASGPELLKQILEKLQGVMDRLAEVEQGQRKLSVRVDDLARAQDGPTTGPAYEDWYDEADADMTYGEEPDARNRLCGVSAGDVGAKPPVPVRC
jgi:hypothetical protein